LTEMSFYDVPVGEIMNPNPPLIDKGSSVHEVAEIVCKKNHVWVVEERDSKKVVGFITEKDLLDIISPLPMKSYTIAVIRPKSLRHSEFEKAEDIMTRPVIKCHLQTTAEEALNLMADNRVRRLAVTDDGEIVGEVALNAMLETYFTTTPQDKF